jgi:hypothetical protein
MGLFYAVFRTFALTQDQISRHGRLFLLGLFTAGICALKASHIPGCLMVLAACGFAEPEGTFRGRIGLLIAIVALAGFLLLPWMIISHQTYGTPLYPLLGSGYAQSFFSRYTDILYSSLITSLIKPMIVLTLGSPFFIAGLVLAWNGFSHSSQAGRIGTASFFGSWIAAVATLSITAEGERFSFPYTTAATLFLLVLSGALPAEHHAESHSSRHKRYVGFAMLMLILGATWTSGLRQIDRRIASVMWGNSRWNSEATQLRSMQGAIPEGSAILVHLSRPFLLDFQRNTVYVADIPGAVSPPPGIPVQGDAEQFAEYMRAQSIRYLAYSYGDEAGFPPRHKIVDYSGYPRWRAAYALVVAFQERLEEVGRMYTRVFDDGNVYVVDLQKRHN